MKKAKRTLALILSVLLLAACSKAAPAEQAAPTEDDGEEYHGEMPIVKEGDEPITISLALISSANVTDYKDNAYTKWIEEQTGLNLDIIQFMDNKTAGTQIALMIASGEKLPDIIWRVGAISKQQGESYGQDGYFLPLTDYFEKYGYYFHQAFDLYFPDNPEILELTMRRGAGADNQPLYGFPSLTKGAYSDAMIQAWINQEWLDKLGLEKPTTIDELYDVLIAFRDKDPNGNGKRDEIPLVGRVYGSFSASDPLNYLFNAFVYYNDNTYFYVEDGKLDSPYKSDEFREALKFANKLYKEGLMTEQCFTQSNAELKGFYNPAPGEDFKAGIIFGVGETMFHKDSDSLRVYEPLQPLKDATGKGGYAQMGYSRAYTTFISADCKHPVEAFKLLDFMCSPESYLRQRWGIYGTDWVYSGGGKTGNRGGEAKIKVLDTTVYSEQNNHCWHYDYGTVVDKTYWQYEVDLSDPNDWDAIHVRKCNEMYNYTMEGKHPKEQFDFAIYSLSDYEERSEFAGELTNFIRNRRASFITGNLDPNSDADWQDYLNGLDSLKYDRWIELAQIGYNRIFE